MSFSDGFPTAAALAAAREEYPPLVGLLDFYEALWRVQMTAGQDIAGLELDTSDGPQRLARGRPLLRFEQLPLDRAVFNRLVHDLRAVIEQYNPALLEQYEGEDPANGEWLVLAGKVFEDPALWLGQSTELNLPTLLAGLAMVPYLKWAAHVLGPVVQEEEKNRWRRPFCPVCGGHPDFATLGEGVGARRLMCSRCDTLWSYRRVGCPFCRNEDKQVYYEAGGERHRLYVCLACRRYLKTLDRRRAPVGIDLRIDRVVTVAMDLAAQEQGYGLQLEEVSDDKKGS